MFYSTRLVLVKLLKNLLSRVSFRGKGTLLLAVCPKKGSVEIAIFGAKFNCDLSDHIQRSIFLFGYDTDAVSFIKSRVSPGDVFFDIGANVGFYTYLASSLVGESGRVFSFEPNPTVFAKLSNTIQANNIQNVEAMNCGLGSVPGTLNLYLNQESGNATASMVKQSNPDAIPVAVKTIADVVSEYNIERIAYLKIDVDGFEPEVFLGAKELLNNGVVSSVQSEFCDYWLRENGTSTQQLHASLLAAGFIDVNGVPHFEENCVVDRFFVWNSPSNHR